MDRRSFLASTGALVAVPQLARIGLPRAGSHGSRLVDLTMRAQREHRALAGSASCQMLTYNSDCPGPVVELREGDRARLVLENQLDEISTIHWHGLHLPNAMDGSPLNAVARGTRYVYEFDVPRGSAGTYWYHPHPPHRTGYQVAHGLHGALIIRADDDPIAHLPERLLVFWDNRLDAQGNIDIPDPDSIPGRIDFENGREGPLHFVNGKLAPEFTIRAGEVQRWRLVNASAARFYRLALEGHTLLHVGSDGGLFEIPVEVPEILLAPAERAEVLVRATADPGTRVTLRSLPYDRYIPQTRPADWREPCDLATLAYSKEPPVPSPAIPARLRVVPPLREADATVTRTISMSQGLINGKKMDPDRVDVSARLGATELWHVENLVGLDHPFHLHGFQFQVVSRNGEPEPFRCWKDTVNVPKHEEVRFLVRFDDFPGKWMFHCHILDHEDHGMMGILEVR